MAAAINWATRREFIADFSRCCCLASEGQQVGVEGRKKGRGNGSSREEKERGNFCRKRRGKFVADKLCQSREGCCLGLEAKRKKERGRRKIYLLFATHLLPFNFSSPARPKSKASCSTHWPDKAKETSGRRRRRVRDNVSKIIGRSLIIIGLDCICALRVAAAASLAERAQKLRRNASNGLATGRPRRKIPAHSLAALALHLRKEARPSQRTSCLYRATGLLGRLNLASKPERRRRRVELIRMVMIIDCPRGFVYKVSPTSWRRRRLDCNLPVASLSFKTG